MRKITIDFPRWLFRDRSEGKEDSTYLLDHSGNMCCLGFCMNQLYPELDILDEGVPYIVLNRNDKLTETEGSVERNNLLEMTDAAININDDHYMPWKMKVIRLTELFRRHGFILEFINLPVKT